MLWVDKFGLVSNQFGQEGKINMATKKETTTKKTIKEVKPAKAEKVEAAVKAEKPVKPAVKASALSVSMFALTGKEAGTLDLPKDIFGAKVNEALLAQAIRVYMNNQKGHFSNTKTRGEVEGSTRKIYRQKGTGKARHGGVRAPIFVGGGIALGPKSRTVILDLPKKMKKAALISALSQKQLDKGIMALSGLEKASGKTSEISKLVKSLNKKSILIVSEANEMAKRASQNLKNVGFISAEDINTFEVVKAQSLAFTKGAVEALEKRLFKKEESADSK